MTELTRRSLLLRSGALGCSLAASPLLTQVSMASGAWENRLVVIILRGGMDGIDVIRPVHDPQFRALRPEATNGLTLHDGFALHPALAPLQPLWQAGEMAAIQATSTPYRDKRSHFDGQDHLETGANTPGISTQRDGWLNRFLQAYSNTHYETAYALGSGDMVLARGDAEVARWSPGIDLMMTDHTLRLANLVMHDDPLFQARFAEAVANAGSDGDDVTVSQMTSSNMQSMLGTLNRRANESSVAKFAARCLRAESRIVAFSLNGWDTHRAQDRGLSRALPRLATALMTLKSELGPVWNKTTVLAITEFGRTVALNGTAGTDRGTGGTMLLAGGGLKKAQVAGRWPGLEEADLYQRRDIMPTSDLRAHVAWALRHSFGTERGVLERDVFPGLDMDRDLGLFA